MLFATSTIKVGLALIPFLCCPSLWLTRTPSYICPFIELSFSIFLPGLPPQLCGIYSLLIPAGASLSLAVEGLMASPEPSDHTHSLPASSSPTLHVLSSRANSLAPSEFPPSDDGDKLPIPMDVGMELDELNVNLESLPSIDNPSDLSKLEKEQIEALQLRGSWGEPNCPRAGDHVPLWRELL